MGQHADSESTGKIVTSRRQAMKTIVGGITTIAAFQILPAKWGKPLIESVFIPAHAATSGATRTYWIDSSTDPIHWFAVTVNPDGSATIVRVNQLRSRRWEASLSSTPGSGVFVNVANAVGCGVPSLTPPVTIEITAITDEYVDILYYGVVTERIPAATIPPVPALTGSCGSGGT